MSEFTGFEAAPHRSIWPSLVEAADSLRLRRLFAEARLMMTALRTSAASGKNFPLIDDAEWREFSHVIVAEEEKRRLLKNSIIGEDEPGTCAFLAVSEIEHPAHRYQPRVGDIVSALGQLGEFEVTSVDAEMRSVDLRLVDYDFRARAVPWQVLELVKLAGSELTPA
jgi:hypothetical protein